MWPSAAYAAAVADRLRANGRRNFSSIVSYYGGHGVAAVLPLLPLATSGVGFAQLAEAEARTAAWFRLLALLQRLR